MTDKETNCILDMTSILPGLRSSTLARYLYSAEQAVGPEFSAVRAIDDLIIIANMLKTELLKEDTNV